MSPNTAPTIYEHLVRAAATSPEAIATFAAWKPAWAGMAAAWSAPIDRALAGGLAADRPSWAFASGYQAAIQHLMPPTSTGEVAALCITEQGLPHPARIECRLTPDANESSAWCVEGAKSFVTGASSADALWVAASTGLGPDGRNQIRMVRVAADDPAVHIEPRPALGIVPEVPHARVRFASVQVSASALAPGDGYVQIVKPFRTLEDLYVSAAFAAWLFGVGRRAGWPHDTLQSLLACISGARGLAQASPSAPGTHIALEGLLRHFADLLAHLDPLFDRVEASLRHAWARDRAVLDIAHAAREARIQRAWQQVESGGDIA